MNDIKHAEILNAYLSRIHVRDLERLVEAQKDCWHASLNLGMSSQIAAQKDARNTAIDVVNKINNHDKSIIESLVLML